MGSDSNTLAVMATAGRLTRWIAMCIVVCAFLQPIGVAWAAETERDYIVLPPWHGAGPEPAKLRAFRRTTVQEARETRRLKLAGGQLRDIGFLQYFTSLEHLDLSSSAIEDLTPLRHCPNLRSLFLFQAFRSGGEGRPVDLAPLAQLPRLEVLDLSYNSHRVTAMESLFQLKHLWALNLRSTGWVIRATDPQVPPQLAGFASVFEKAGFVYGVIPFEVIPNLPRLELLDIGHCFLAGPEALQQSTSLKTLILDALPVNHEFLWMRLDEESYRLDGLTFDEKCAEAPVFDAATLLGPGVSRLYVSSLMVSEVRPRASRAPLEILTGVLSCVDESTTDDSVRVVSDPQVSVGDAWRKELREGRGLSLLLSEAGGA